MISRARPGDLKEIIRISKKVFPDFSWVSRKKLARCIRDGFSFVWREKGKITGALVANIDEEDPYIIEIQYIGVLKRGKGIGSALLKRLEKEIKGNKKIRALLVWTEDASRFYVGHGFRVCGYIDYPKACTGLVKRVRR